MIGNSADSVLIRIRADRHFPEALKSMIAEAVEEGSKHGSQRFLVDHRDMIPELPTW
jgi:hypothetical protein